jgi:hypothetical protein
LQKVTTSSDIGYTYMYLKEGQYGTKTTDKDRNKDRSKRSPAKGQIIAETQPVFL